MRSAEILFPDADADRYVFIVGLFDGADCVRSAEFQTWRGADRVAQRWTLRGVTGR